MSGGTTRRPTSFDVAERAGVSQSTVSRALAGSPSITEETRSRVEAAAAALGYHVDARAARLRSGRTGTMAIVVVGRAGSDPTRVSGFHYALLGSTCAAAAECGYQSLVAFQSDPGEFAWNYVAQGQADGLVVMGTSVSVPRASAIAPVRPVVAFRSLLMKCAPYQPTRNRQRSRLIKWSANCNNRPSLACLACAWMPKGKPFSCQAMGMEMPGMPHKLVSGV